MIIFVVFIHGLYFCGERHGESENTKWHKFVWPAVPDPCQRPPLRRGSVYQFYGGVASPILQRGSVYQFYARHVAVAVTIVLVAVTVELVLRRCSADSLMYFGKGPDPEIIKGNETWPGVVRSPALLRARRCYSKGNRQRGAPSQYGWS